MAERIASRLQTLGIELPQAATPAANYVPFVITGNQVFVAGQIPFWNGTVKYIGKVGRDFSADEGKAAARLCGLNLIAQVKNAVGGDLDRVVRVVKLGVFVNCTEDFGQQPEVANGASDLMVDVFGEAGRHARFAVGVNTLPRNVATEADAVFEIS